MIDASQFCVVPGGEPEDALTCLASGFWLLAGIPAGAVGQGLTSSPWRPLRGCVGFLEAWWLGSKSKHPESIRLKVHHGFTSWVWQSCSLRLPSFIGKSESHSGPLGSIQFSSVAQSCPTLDDPMDCSTPGLPVHHQLPEFTHTHVHRVGDAIQPSHPLSSPSPPAPNPSQHQGLFK